MPRDFVEPVSMARRIADIGFLVFGLSVVGYALCAGGAALLVLPFGIAVTAAAVWLLSRRHRMRPPPAIAKMLDEALTLRLGLAASTPDARAEYIRGYLEGVGELRGSMRGLWFAGFGVGRGTHDVHDPFVHFSVPGREVLAAVTPSGGEHFSVRVAGLTEAERDAAQQGFDVQRTRDPEVLALGKLTPHETVNAVEHLFGDALGLGAGYELTARLTCRLPAWTYGNAEG